MVISATAAPMFWYVFCPDSRVAAEGDGGFTVALYPDSMMTFTVYNRDGQVKENTGFQLPTEVVGRYMTILDSQSWWMGKVPLEIKADGQCEYASMFGFVGHPLFLIEDINRLVLSPFNSQRGMFARRLRMMLESIAEMLYDYGIGLTVNSFVWDWTKIQPIGSMTGQSMAMVQPNAEQMPAAEEHAGEAAM